jgi:hypothetical protein
MKLDRDTLDRMRDAIAPLDTPQTRERYRAGDFPRADRVRDLDKRYRWDIYYAAGGYRLHPEDDSITDAHIYTALKRIVPSLNGEG